LEFIVFSPSGTQKSAARSLNTTAAAGKLGDCH
jgi:hypothetical protein